MHLRIVHGLRGKGGGFDLAPGAPRIVGRGKDADISLPDGMVSGEHASIEVDGDGVIVRDLGSANRTFVNARSVTSVRATTGDLVLVGGTILRVESDELDAIADSERGLSDPNAPVVFDLQEVPLRVVLRFLQTSRKSAEVSIEGPDGRASLSYTRGSLVGVHVANLQGKSPRQALELLAAWRGTATLDPPTAGGGTAIAVETFLDADQPTGSPR